MRSKPVIGVTMGDAAGIGPEIISKALSRDDLLDQADYIVYGSRAHILSAFSRYSIQKNLPPSITLVDPMPLETTIPMGKLSALSGQASYDYVCRAVQEATAGRLSAMVTAPITKESWQLAGIPYPGHTEVLADKSKTTDCAMAFYCTQLRVVLATSHLPLNQVAQTISSASILSKIKLAHQFCKQLGNASPRIGVAGLNPHAGENGLLGMEDLSIIRPAVEEAIASGIQAIGPLPADTLFYQAVHENKFHIIVAMYHDQGLAPLKLLAFKDAVNVTLGLPFIRTSPDHGTAYDIAGKGLASPSSMIEAIKLAIRLSSL